MFFSGCQGIVKNKFGSIWSRSLDRGGTYIYKLVLFRFQFFRFGSIPGIWQNFGSIPVRFRVPGIEKKTKKIDSGSG